LRIPGQLVDEIVAHAREEVPNECCGVLCGENGRVTSVERAGNEFASPLRYRISADDMMRIYKAAESRGEEMLGYYHSHVRSPAFPSQTDINEAGGIVESFHLICSLADPEAPSVRAFMIRGVQVEEVELDVE
jgi:[CysO sulfur-carrier protein]-S-L-cysteine hydrolase